MGSDSHYQIPAIDFSIISTELDRGTRGWYNLCKRVREACENYGCFEIVYDKIPLELKTETFSMLRQLFNLPVETKEKNVDPKPFHGYYGRYPATPFYESFGIEDSSNYESFKSFTRLMWPNGHDQFCNTVVTMMKKLDELKEMTEMMILDSYGLGEKLNSIIACKTLLRVMKYDAPPSGKYANGHYGLTPHTDKLVSTILCDDQVSGLEFETKDGKWIKLSLSPTSYLFIVGVPLMAWSNGRMLPLDSRIFVLLRLSPLKHRVMISGEKERYSLGAFGSPLEGTIIKAAKELVDEEHPRILKDFDYKDFSKFTFTQEGSIIDSEKQVFAFGGVAVPET